MRKLIKSVSLSILLGVAFIGAAWAQTFNAAVNRTEVPQGETFVLTLELADGSDSGNPDLSVLDKDFIVYSVGNAFSYNYINGVASKSRQWQIALMPKNSGKITVPSIKLGNLETQPITLNVIPASAAATETSAGTGGYQAPQQMNRPKFSMTAEIGNPNPYVQQQVDYTLKIYDTGGLQGDMPQFIEDGSNNWIIRSLGEPTVGSKIVNGRSLLIFFQITQDKRGISGILRVFLNQIIGKINTDIYGRRQLREYFFAGGRQRKAFVVGQIKFLGVAEQVSRNRQADKAYQKQNDKD